MVESTVSGAADNSKLLGNNQGELVDDIDVPVIEATSEAVVDNVHEDSLLDVDVELHGHEDWTFDDDF